ncbi:MAG: PAS domain S-box protein, partial [Ferruginibacter sp.]
NQSVENSITTGEPFDYEAVIVTANKNEVWVRSIGHAEFVDGKCTRIYGSFQDINSLKQSENRLLSLTENLPGVVYQYIIHPDGTDAMHFISGAVEQLWGYTIDEVLADINLLWNQIKRGGDIEQVKSTLTKSIQTKSRWTCRFKVVMPNGELKTHFGNSGAPVFLADGRILLNVIILDITKEVKNEELLEQASKLAKIASWEVEFTHNKPVWSKMMHQILETDPDQYIPDLQSNLNFCREDFRLLAQSSFQECIEKGTPVDFEAIIVTAFKNERWVRILGNVEIIDDKLKRVYGSMQDIDASKKAEEKLRESELKFKRVFDSKMTGIIFSDENGEISDANDRFLEIVGYSRQDLQEGKLKWNEMTPPEYLKMDMQGLKQIALTGVSQPFEKEYFRKDGSRVHILIGAAALGKQSSIKGVAYITDITQRKTAEKDIKDSEEKRRLIMNGALDAIISIDIHETITFWNPQAERIFGWKESEVIGKPLSELIIPQQYRKYHIEGLKNYLKTGDGKALNILMELSAIRRSGEEFPIELTIIPIKQSGEEFFCAFIRDITQRKRAEQEKNNLQATLEKSLNEIHIFDAETLQYSYINEITLLNLGYKEDELKALTALD